MAHHNRIARSSLTNPADEILAAREPSAAVRDPGTLRDVHDLPMELLDDFWAQSPRDL